MLQKKKSRNSTPTGCTDTNYIQLSVTTDVVAFLGLGRFFRIFIGVMKSCEEAMAVKTPLSSYGQTKGTRIQDLCSQRL